MRNMLYGRKLFWNWALHMPVAQTMNWILHFGSYSYQCSLPLCLYVTLIYIRVWNQFCVCLIIALLMKHTCYIFIWIGLDIRFVRFWWWLWYRQLVTCGLIWYRQQVTPSRVPSTSVEVPGRNKRRRKCQEIWMELEVIL